MKKSARQSSLLTSGKSRTTSGAEVGPSRKKMREGEQAQPMVKGSGYYYTTQLNTSGAADHKT